MKMSMYLRQLTKADWFNSVLGFIIFTTVFVSVAPSIADHVETSSHIQKLFNVKTVGEYMAATNTKNIDGLELHFWAANELIFCFVMPPFSDLLADETYLQLHGVRLFQ